jgi:Fe-coproporphyrin III synthase
VEGLVAVTYRCNARCTMCNIWASPSRPDQEVTVADLDKLPRLAFANITGGEPFLRDDIADIAEVISRKADRVVVSTNGYFTERVLEVARRFPRLGFRISLEGLPAANDELRGLKDGFDHGLRTLLSLRQLGRQDIGFGITLSDRNADDVLELYELAEAMGMEFATAAVHNTYYFHKYDNRFENPERVAQNIEELARRLLSTGRPKNWFRAWFNLGLANYVRGGSRLLPCNVGSDLFFVDPFGEVRPCNGMEESMGSLKTQSFAEIWEGPKAAEVRAKVAGCRQNCWMIGSVAPAMKRAMPHVSWWVARAKLTGRFPPCT